MYLYIHTIYISFFLPDYVCITKVADTASSRAERQHERRKHYIETNYLVLGFK